MRCGRFWRRFWGRGGRRIMRRRRRGIQVRRGGDDRSRSDRLVVGMSMTSDQVVVDHSHGLHEGVDDGWADEFEAAGGEVFGDIAGDVGLGGDLLYGFEAI